MNKRGLNSIITTALIILLVLVAIALLWFFFKPTTTQAGEELSNVGQCLNIIVEPVDCKYYYIDESSGCFNSQTMVGVTVRRTGSGDLTGLDFVFTDAVGNIRHVTPSSLLSQPLPGESEFSLNGMFLDAIDANTLYLPEKVEVYLRLGDDKKLCQSLAPSVTCKLDKTTLANKCADCNSDTNLDLGDFTCFGNGFAIQNQYADFNGDGIFDVRDYGAFCNAFSTCDCSGCATQMCTLQWQTCG